MWFEEAEKGPNKGDPFNYSTHTIETKVKKEIVSNKTYLTSAPKSPIRRTEHSDNDDDKSEYSLMYGTPKVERNKSVIPSNHPYKFLHPDSDDSDDEKRKRKEKRRRSRSRTPVSSASRNEEENLDEVHEDVAKLQRKKSKRRKAIVNANSAVTLGKDNTFLDVKLFSDEKQRTLSGKRRKSKGKIGVSRDSSYDNSESFTKAREPKRIESVDIPDDTDYDKSVSSISTTNIGLDQVPAKAIAEKIGVSINTLKRLQLATGYSNAELVDGHAEFHEKFVNGVVTKKDFKILAKDIGVNKWEASSFTENVFKMFDLNGDQALTFEEFMFATSAQNFSDTTQKLGWLFDNVYDRDHDGRINRMEIKDILRKLLIMEGFDKEKSYWMVENCFQKVHHEQMEKLNSRRKLGAEQEATTSRILDGKMDKKGFLEYINGSKFIAGLLAAKSDTVRKGKMEMDIKKVDVANLDIRSSKPTRNSQREVSVTKNRRSARLSTRRKTQAKTRSRSANRMESDEEDVFSTLSARI